MLDPRQQQLAQNIQLVLTQVSSFAITQENIIWLMQQIGAYQQEWDFVVQYINSLVYHPHFKQRFAAAGSCSLCHGTGSYWSAADAQKVKCVRCGGSGIG